MRGKYGIVLANEGEDVRDNDPIYDSRYRKVMVDPKKKPAHLQIVELNGGTSFSYANNEYGEKSEYIFTLPHGMPYTPQVYGYFYIRDAPARAGGNAIGKYSYNNLFLFTITAEGFFEQWHVKADNQNVYIQHIAFRNGGTGAVSTMGAQVTLRIKIIITQLRNTSRFLRI